MGWRESHEVWVTDCAATAMNESCMIVCERGNGDGDGDGGGGGSGHGLIITTKISIN